METPLADASLAAGFSEALMAGGTFIREEVVQIVKAVRP
jgi:hypothetical protein